MSRASKRKLAIVAGISECLVNAEAKICAFEMHGDPKYYVCPRTEYCCSFGCCGSPGFQIYHLWYYWLLVIIMFLVCSGGGWWYRYWLQGRYRAAASAIPSRGAGSSRSQSAMRGASTCPAQQASITYNSARNTVLLHRMWKAGPHRGAGSSPAYPGPPLATAASSTHFQNTSVVLNDANCPYYQLYGPPPSYETVIAQTRSKLSSPMSPERTRNLDATSATGSAALTSLDHVPRCYDRSFYNSHPSQAGAIAGIQDSSPISRYEQTANITESMHQIDAHGGSAAFTPYATAYSSNSNAATPVHPAVRQDTCVPMDYHGVAISQLDYDADPATIVPDTFRIYHSGNLERLPSYHGERTSLDPKARKINTSPLPGCSMREQQRSLLSGDSHSSVPDLKTEAERGEVYGRKGRIPRDDERERYARQHGGSLKFTRARDEAHPAAVTYGSFRRGETFLEIATGSGACRGNAACEDEPATARVAAGGSSEATSAREGRIREDLWNSGAQGTFSRSTRNGLLNGENSRGSLRRYGYQQQQQQKPKTNPSDNVILDPLNSAIKFVKEAASVETPVGDGETEAEKPACWRTRRRELDEKRHGRRVPSPGDRRTNYDDTASVVMNNHESKHNKLDRSKSLD